MFMSEVEFRLKLVLNISY